MNPNENLLFELEEKATPGPWEHEDGELEVWWRDEIEVCLFDSMDPRADNAANRDYVEALRNTALPIIRAKNARLELAEKLVEAIDRGSIKDAMRAMRRSSRHIGPIVVKRDDLELIRAALAAFQQPVEEARK